MTHYHVGINIPGYLPEGDVSLALSKREAIEILGDHKKQILEDHYTLGDEADSIRVSGSARRDMGYLVTYPDRRYHLGLSIWAEECHEEECLEERSEI